MAKDNNYYVDILGLAMDVIDEMQKNPREYQKPNILASSLGVNRTRIYRILKTLEQCGYIEYNPLIKGFRLSVKFVVLGERVMQSLDLRAAAESTLQNLATEFNEAAFLQTLVDDHAICIDFFSGHNVLHVTTLIGTSMPLHASAGAKILLAFMPDQERMQLIGKLDLTPITRNTITNRGELIKHLEIIRKQGYSTNNEESDVGYKAIGAPIRDWTGKVIASISVDIPSHRYPEEKREQFINTVLDGAAEISRKLGFNEMNLLENE